MLINAIKTGMLFFILTGLVLGAAYLLGGEQALLPAVMIAAVMNVVAYFFSDKIALMTMQAHEVGPDNELYQIVQALTIRAGMPMPRVYISPMAAPNAFATGRNPNHAAVCATQGLLQVLDRDEVAGVMAHELAHVRHRDILLQTIAATLAGAITYLGYMFMFGGGRHNDDEGGGHPLAGLLVLILGPIAAGLVQAAISRQREYAADSGGAEILGDPRPLASALEKIHNYGRRIPMDVNPAFNSMFIMEPLNPLRTMANLFATHPPLEARLENLLGQPAARMHR